MDEMTKYCQISDEDLRAALKEMKTYIDITEDDLRKIYTIALQYAQKRVSSRIFVRDAMTRNVIKVREDADINEVMTLLSEHRISGLPVVDGEDRVIGMVTEADILAVAGMKKGFTFKDIIRHLLGEPLSGPKRSQRLLDVMTSPAITTGPEADIRDVALTIEEKRIKRLPVVDEQGRLLGVISRADIIKFIGEK